MIESEFSSSSSSYSAVSSSKKIASSSNLSYPAIMTLLTSPELGVDKSVLTDFFGEKLKHNTQSQRIFQIMKRVRSHKDVQRCRGEIYQIVNKFDKLQFPAQLAYRLSEDKLDDKMIIILINQLYKTVIELEKLLAR